MRALSIWGRGAAIAAATLAIGLTVVTPAGADTIYDYNGIPNVTYRYGSTTVEFTHNTFNGHLQSIIRVTGSGTGEDRALCQRANGGTAWYQSTIQARGGATSHYDCNHNGTYNRALVGQGVDLL
jgi:hypothetical protein